MKIKEDKYKPIFQTELEKIDDRKPQEEEHNPIENIQKDNNNSTELSIYIFLSSIRNWKNSINILFIELKFM